MNMAARWLQQGQGLAPGILMSLLLAIAAQFMSDHYGAPAVVTALLLGMAFYFLSQEGPCVCGIDYSSTTLLKLAVALLGFRVGLQDITGLGTAPLMLVPGLILFTIAAGVVIALIFRRDRYFGLLSGGAVAICGASAALALSAVLPQTTTRARDTLFTVVAVTTLSSVAMIAYPILFAGLGFTDQQIGILIGATVHDVAQVVGAGYAVSEEAGDTATLVKLFRIIWLPAAVLGYALLVRTGTGTSKLHLPWFIWVFAALLALNSTGWVPVSVIEMVQTLDRWLLITAIGALGMKTSLQTMGQLGWPHILIVVGQTLLLCAAAMLAVWVM